MQTITISVEVRLASGPAWASTQQLMVDAVDVIDVVIASGATDFKVPVQPGGVVKMILVSPDPASGELSYKSETSGTEIYKLDQPHLLMGEGGVGMLEGAVAPTSLFFSKSGTTDARVSILVGRDLSP